VELQTSPFLSADWRAYRAHCRRRETEALAKEAEALRVAAREAAEREEEARAAAAAAEAAAQAVAAEKAKAARGGWSSDDDSRWCICSGIVVYIIHIYTYLYLLYTYLCVHQGGQGRLEI